MVKYIQPYRNTEKRKNMFTDPVSIKKENIKNSIVNALRIYPRKQTFAVLWNTDTKLIVCGPEHERLNYESYSRYNKEIIGVWRNMTMKLPGYTEVIANKVLRTLK